MSTTSTFSGCSSGEPGLLLINKTRNPERALAIELGRIESKLGTSSIYLLLHLNTDNPQNTMVVALLFYLPSLSQLHFG